MLFPLGTDRSLRHRTVVTYALLVANVAIFLGQQAIMASNPDDYLRLMSKFMVSRGEFSWWQLVTASFLHLGWWHLAGNSLFLWVFGPNIEDRFGRFGFLVMYIVGGAAAMGGHLAVSQNPAAGASGSVAALTGAYLIMFPRTNIKVFSLWGYVGVTWVAAWWFIGFSIVWDIVGAASGARGVAYGAHLAGYLFGAGVAYGLLAVRLLPREPFDLFSASRQAARRTQFRAAARQTQTRIQAKVGSGGVSEQEAAAQQALSDARARVGALIVAGDLTGAAGAYRSLADTYGHLPRAACLPREKQYELANHLYVMKDYASAAYAYERFLECYPKDPESPSIRFLLGRINARELNDPVRAKVLLAEAVQGLWDDQTREMAKAELESLG